MSSRSRKLEFMIYSGSFHLGNLDATSKISPNNWAFTYFLSHKSCNLTLKMQQKSWSQQLPAEKTPSASTFVSHPWNYTPHPWNYIPTPFCTFLLSCIHHISLPELSFKVLNSQQLIPYRSLREKPALAFPLQPVNCTKCRSLLFPFTLRALRFSHRIYVQN